MPYTIHLTKTECHQCDEKELEVCDGEVSCDE